MADNEVTGTLTSGGVFRATPSMIEVTYPGGDRPPVTIDLAEIAGVERSGNEVTLIREDERQTVLRTVALEEAGRLEALVGEVLAAGQADVFQRRIARLHSDGYRVVAATPRMAQLVRPKTFSFVIATVLLVLGIAPAVGYIIYALYTNDAEMLVVALLLALSVLPPAIYIFYYLDQRDATALILVESSGRVTVRRQEYRLFQRQAE